MSLRCPRRSGLVVGVLATFWLTASAWAAFPGANGWLAVEPQHGSGIVLVGADGHGARRICVAGFTCGAPKRPRWSADGRALVFAGPSVRTIATDGSCLNCLFGVAANPAFEPQGNVISFVHNGSVAEDGVDGIRQNQPGLGVASDAVWSAGDRLAVVRHGVIWVGARRALRRLAEGSQPSWSPTGGVIAADQRGWIVTVDVRSGRTTRLVRGSAPAFSPDGRWIAFVGRGGQLMITSPRAHARPRAVGRIHAVSVDWQPRPRTPQPGCMAPPGSKVLASTTDAVVTADPPGTSAPLDFPDGPPSAYMGCLRVNGLERLLERFDDNNIDSASSIGLATLAAPYAGLVMDWSDDHYGGQSSTLQVFDLRTGHLTTLGGETVSCPDYSYVCVPAQRIDRVALARDGVSAVHAAGAEDIGSLSRSIQQVSCGPASTVCAAIDSGGQFFSTGNPAAEGAAWTADRVPGGTSGGPYGLACPSTTLCVAASGQIYTSSDPGAAPATWTQTTFPTGVGADSVSCPSPTLCVVATLDGRIATSTNPAGGTGTWSLTPLAPTSASSAVFCSAPSRCFATFGAASVFTSSNPSGGTGAWSRTSHTPPFQSGACPATTLCIALAGKDIYTTTDPAAETWGHASAPEFLSAVSCASPSLCVAVGADGSVEVSTDPASGTWTHSTIDSGTELSSVTCPSAALCVAGDIHGHIVASPDPTAGPASWKRVLVAGDPCTDTTPCSEEQIQVSDRSGVRTIDTSRLPGAGPFLTDLTLTGDVFSWNHSGASRTITLQHSG